MAVRRRAATTRSRGPGVQSFDWARSFGSVSIDMTAAGFQELAVALPSSNLGETVRRVRGRITVFDQTQTSQLVLGIYVRSEAVTTQFQDPLGATGKDSDEWMGYLPLGHFGSPILGANDHRCQAMFDVKAQRKLPNGRELSFILAWTGGSGTAASNVVFNFSLLGSLTRA